METIFSDSGALMLDGSGTKRVQEYIQKEFAKARSMPTVSTYMKSRDADKAQVVDTTDDLLKMMIDTAADPEVEIVELEPKKPAKPLVPLAHQAAPILASIGKAPAMLKHRKVVCWRVDEVKETPETLFKQALVSLGFKPKLDDDGLKCNLTTKKPFWRKFSK